MTGINMRTHMGIPDCMPSARGSNQPNLRCCLILQNGGGRVRGRKRGKGCGGKKGGGRQSGGGISLLHTHTHTHTHTHKRTRTEHRQTDRQTDRHAHNTRTLSIHRLEFFEGEGIAIRIRIAHAQVRLHLLVIHHALRLLLVCASVLCVRKRVCVQCMRAVRPLSLSLSAPVGAGQI